MIAVQMGNQGEGFTIMKLAIALAFGVSAIASATAYAPSATAATPSVSTSVAPMSVSRSCDYGSYYGYVSTTLSNGWIETVFCRYSNGNVSQVNTDYHKTGGSNVRLRNFWEWSPSNGSASYGRRYDAGSFTASAGHEYPFTWRYAYPGIAKANSNAPCTRGGVLQTSNSVYFTTRVSC